MVEMFEVGPCEDAYQMGFLIGQRFSNMIRSRLSKDLILQNQLRPFAQAPESQPLIKELEDNNRKKFPRYWDELVGIADGSEAHVLDVILINFRKEILPFLPKTAPDSVVDNPDDCSDVLVVGDTMAIAAHNEDANVALVGHTYLIRATLSDGQSFTGYTYAGELPTCAFGFNSHGLAFTLNSVPPSEDEIVAGGIGRNFVSRDLLESTGIDDALKRIQTSEVSVGHSYNLIDIRSRKILNVETASRSRISVQAVGEMPFFHANMYLHLQVKQVMNLNWFAWKEWWWLPTPIAIPSDTRIRNLNYANFIKQVKYGFAKVHDENSVRRLDRAAVLPKRSKDDILSVLGDVKDQRYPIYMTGPVLYTLCTAMIDLDDQTLAIIEGNPDKENVSYVFFMSSGELKISQ